MTQADRLRELADKLETHASPRAAPSLARTSGHLAEAQGDMREAATGLLSLLDKIDKLRAERDAVDAAITECVDAFLRRENGSAAIFSAFGKICETLGRNVTSEYDARAASIRSRAEPPNTHRPEER